MTTDTNNTNNSTSSSSTIISSIFERSKITVLGKRDKSFAGRIDVRAVDICAILNSREEYYTLSSCSGRCFLYRGDGVKSTTSFQRYRISHDTVDHAERYFNVGTLREDPTGGADPVRTVGQYDYKKQSNNDTNNTIDNITTTTKEDKKSDTNDNDNSTNNPSKEEMPNTTTCCNNVEEESSSSLLSSSPLWLRMEPFILHVACCSLSAANTLMSTARPAFKNVGITSLSSKKIVVAIWGDEGLELPLTAPSSTEMIYKGQEVWLQQLVNERLERNWTKIVRFVNALRDLPPYEEEEEEVNNTNATTKIPKSYDVIGDIAILHGLPDNDDNETEEDYETRLQKLGEAVLESNGAIKLCAARVAPLTGPERSESTMRRLASRHTNRLHPSTPLVTTHVEYGVPCVINVEKCFFSPRMGQERLRLANSVARGEHVLVLFAGVGMEALQFAARTEASRVVAMEQNPVAVDCARKSLRMLRKRKKNNPIPEDRILEFLEGDVLQLLPQQPPFFDRIVAPRPKEIMDKREGDLGDGTAGIEFLRALLPVLKPDGGECHWYDFVADHEFPDCVRTRTLIERTCRELNLSNPQFIHTAKVGSVAKRQYRVCVDFRLCG